MCRYIQQCVNSQDPLLPRMQVIGNGDVFDQDVLFYFLLLYRCSINVWNTIMSMV